MRWLPLFGIALAIGLVFGSILGHDFLSWDDDVFLTQNPLLQPPSMASLRAIWTQPYAHLYVPVSYTLWWALARLFGQPDENGNWRFAPAPFHAASLLVHLLTALGAYGLLRQLLESRGAAFGGTLLFALHPLQVESVAWASELKDLLGGLLATIAFFLYVCSRRRAQPRLYAAATATFVLALLAKPNVVSLPLVVGVVDCLLLHAPPKTAFRRMAPWLAVALVHAALTRLVQPASTELALPVWQRFFVAGDALAFYFGKLFWPLHLAADYGRQPHIVVSHAWGYLTWLGPTGLLLLTLWLRRRSVWPLVGFLWFSLALLPMLGFLPFDFQQYSTPADHYAYFALLGPAAAFGALVRHARGFYSRLAIIVLFVLLAAQSALQTMTWSHNEIFWRHTLSVNPRSFLAHNNLGAIYLVAGHLSAAEAEFRAALRIKPDDADALINLGLTLWQQQRPAEARRWLERGLQSRPGDPKARLLLGMIAVHESRFGDALDYLQPLAAQEPQNLLARLELARALAGLGRRQEAKQLLQEILHGAPEFGPAQEALKRLEQADRFGQR